jgi:hypothetical protein
MKATCNLGLFLGFSFFAACLRCLRKMPLEKQLDDIHTNTRQAITNTDALHNKKGNNIAR